MSVKLPLWMIAGAIIGGLAGCSAPGVETTWLADEPELSSCSYGWRRRNCGEWYAYPPTGYPVTMPAGYP
jgi:hypothetical protein